MQPGAPNAQESALESERSHVGLGALNSSKAKHPNLRGLHQIHWRTMATAPTSATRGLQKGVESQPTRDFWISSIPPLPLEGPTIIGVSFFLSQITAETLFLAVATG